MFEAIFSAERWKAVPFHLWSAVFFMFGSMVGSFLNVCIHRMPYGQSIVSPPSHCPHCKYAIPWYLNIPLVTWLYLKGRCRNCRAPISIRYFLVELLTAVTFLGCWLAFGHRSAALAIIYSLFLAGLIVATFIDFEHYIIPDEITIGGMAAGFLCSFLVPALQGEQTIKASMQQSLLGMAAGAGIIYFIVRLGKLLFGRLHLHLDPDSRVVFGENGIELPPKRLPFETLARRSSGWFAFRAESVELADRCVLDTVVGVSRDKVTIGSESFARSDAPCLALTVGRVLSPGETIQLAGASPAPFAMLVDWLRPLRNMLGKRNQSHVGPGTRLLLAEGDLWLDREIIPFEEIFYRNKDTIKLSAKRIETQFGSWYEASVEMTQSELRIADAKFNPEAVPKMEVLAERMELPREAMGLGDVKFMGAIGAFLGWQAIVFSLVVSSLLGSVVGVLLTLLSRRAARLPYGPYIALAAALWIFAGKDFVAWYVNFVGHMMYHGRG